MSRVKPISMRCRYARRLRLQASAARLYICGSDQYVVRHFARRTACTAADKLLGQTGHLKLLLMSNRLPTRLLEHADRHMQTSHCNSVAVVIASQQRQIFLMRHG
jgi:hypothetical protein